MFKFETERKYSQEKQKKYLTSIWTNSFLSANKLGLISCSYLGVQVAFQHPNVCNSSSTSPVLGLLFRHNCQTFFFIFF